MTTELIPNSDMQVFSPADIKRAGELLRCPMDEASAIKALIIQRDTGLSLARGEISIVPFNGRPTVMINKQGYLAYAARQPNYDGYESGIETVDGETVAWCRVYNKDISHPVCVKIYEKEYAKNTPIWKEKPRYMLEKTAISLALRASFPILNGTYTDDEIEADTPIRIDPKPTDIKVEPESAPVKATPKKVENTYTYEMVKNSIIPNYEAHKLNTDVVKRAMLDNGLYDKDMIDADYKQQMGLVAKPTTAPTSEPKPEVHTPEDFEQFKAEIIEEATENHKRTIDQPFCVDCGNTRVLPDEEKESRAKYGVALCPKCLSKRITDDIKLKQEGKKALDNLVKASAEASASKQTKPTTDDEKPSDVCSVCGKKLTKGELTKWQLFNLGKPPVCADCSKPKTEN